MISTITGTELQDHLENTTGGPGAFNQNFRLIRAIWKWSAKPPRKWCDMEPIQHLETKETVSSEVGVLTSRQARTLMQTAEKHYPETVPTFAIALFTGMRQQEIERLLPQDITAEGITVPASSAKTKRRRFIQMPTPLLAPPDWNRKQRAVRRLAGWKVWSDLVKDKDGKPLPPPAELPEWPANALRHTAATVAVALGKPIEQLVFEHGHTGGLEMLRRHYVGAMPKREALAIWAIGPNGTKIPNISAA
jgi:integrase